MSGKTGTTLAEKVWPVYQVGLRRKKEKNRDTTKKEGGKKERKKEKKAERGKFTNHTIHTPCSDGRRRIILTKISWCSC